MSFTRRACAQIQIAEGEKRQRLAVRFVHIIPPRISTV